MMADPKEQEEMKTILFTNLQILGMDVTDKEETYKIPFNVDMFNLPNKAGSEMVLYFLFSKLNPSLCKEHFRDCWPVLDRKSEIQFRKVCTNWLISIQKGDAESHMPHVNTALLLSPGGRKFTHLLYSFSTYVLVQVMKSEYGWEAQNSIICPGTNQRSEALDAVVSSAIQDSLIRERDKFFEYGHLTVIANRQWTHYTNALVKEFRCLRKANRDLELEKRQKVKLVTDFCIKQDLSLPAKRTTTMFDTDQNIFATRLGERMKTAIYHWNTLTKFSDFMADKREIFQSILNNTTAKFLIDGTEMGIRVPGLLLRECSKEIQKREIDNIYNGGALNLVSLVQLWNICLNMYKEHFQSENLPSVSSQVPHITAQAHKHHSHLKDVQELSEKMRDLTLPNLRRSIAKMQKKLNSQGVSTDFTDNKTNRLGLILTAPTPPTTTVTRTSNSVGDTPPGSVAGPFVDSESTPEALQKVHYKVEMAVQNGAKVSQESMDPRATSRLMKVHQGSVNKRTDNMQNSKTQLKESSLKLAKPQNSTRNFTTKNSLQHGHNKRLPVQNTASYQTTQTHKIPGKPIDISDYSSTPRTSKQIAVDLLADSIVDSVLNSTDLTVLSDVSVDTLLEFGDLGAEAFQSKSLIKRSPVESSKSFQNLDKSQTSGSLRPKPFSGHHSREDSLHSQASVYNAKSSETSVHHESIFSQNSKDADSSFESVGTELDWSNNAALGEASWLPKANKWRSSKHSSHNSFNEKAADVFNYTENLTDSTAEAVKSGFTNQSVVPATSSTEKTPSPTSKKSLFKENNSNFSEEFNRIDRQEKPSVAQLESEKEQRSNTSYTAHCSTSGEPGMDNSRIVHDDQELFLKLAETPHNTHRSPSSMSRSNRLTACGVTPDMKSLYEKITGQNILYRLPGDGQVSSVQAIQSVSAVCDSDTEMEKTLDKHRLISLSPFIPGGDSLSVSGLLTSPVCSGLQKYVHNHEHGVVSVSPNVLKSDSEKKLQESESLSYSHGRSVSTNLFNQQNIQSNSDDSSIIDHSNTSQEKLLDLETTNVPALVSLHSDDEDLESEQALNDSYTPFKEGIQLDSKSQAKHTLTPTRTVSQHLARTDYPKLSSRVDAIPVSSKLALLQQKALSILKSSYSEELFSAGHERLNVNITNSRNQEDAIIFNTNMDEDADILSTELMNTDLLAGLEDLVSL